MEINSYVNKVVPFKFCGQDMSFELSHGLFSSFDIDTGSRLLLKLIGKNIEWTNIKSVLDIGSGVGILGIACAKASGASLYMRDRDALAVAFSQKNAKRNKIKNVICDQGLFLCDIEDKRFDLALCNVPAKAGIPIIDRFLHDLPGILNDDGYAAIVVVKPIAEAAFASIKDSGASIVVFEEAKGHTAIIMKKGEAKIAKSSIETYKRSQFDFDVGKLRCKMNGYWGLPEFDTASYASSVSCSLLESSMAGLHVMRSAIINPGIGRLACYLKGRAHASVIDLCSRDLLSLQASRKNIQDLVFHGEKFANIDGLDLTFADDFPSHSYDVLVEFADLIPFVDTTDEIWERAGRILKKGGIFLLSTTAGTMDRFEKKKPKEFIRMSDKKKRGYSSTVWRYEG